MILNRNINWAVPLLQRTVREHEEDLDENNPRDFIDTYLIEMRKQSSNAESIFTGTYINLLVKSVNQFLNT
jgi:hypothetical protein